MWGGMEYSMITDGTNYVGQGDFNNLVDINNLLVGGAITILNNMKVNGRDYPIYEMENIKCLKPPTSLALGANNLFVLYSDTFARLSTSLCVFVNGGNIRYT